MPYCKPQGQGFCDVDQYNITVEYILKCFQCRRHMLLVIGHIMRKIVLVESLQKGADQHVYLYSLISANNIYLPKIEANYYS